MHYQNDIFRAAKNVKGAQSGLKRIESVMGLKQLEVHPDKTCQVIIADDKTLNEIRGEMIKDPVIYKGHIIKEKQNEKWLGDIFSSNGLEQSILDTIKDRTGRVKISIFETNSILEDATMQAIGGIRGTIDIWELAIIPMLMNNCDTWLGITVEIENKLENLQELFLRTVL